MVTKADLTVLSNDSLVIYAFLCALNLVVLLNQRKPRQLVLNE